MLQVRHSCECRDTLAPMITNRNTAVMTASQTKPAAML
jgi:hypothetical protein